MGDIVLLKEADRGDASGSGGKARLGVRESDAAEGEDWDVCLAGLFEHRQAGGANGWGVFLFKHWCEDGEGRAFGRGLDDLCRGVAGDSYERSFSRDLGCPTSRRFCEKWGFLT